MLDTLLSNNKAWVASVLQEDPNFFNRLAEQQAPKYLWIGCSDSRVPANTLTGLAPGELFVHRNISNVVLKTDKNCQSVIQFAIEVLKVEHVIICGHYNCGGVAASLDTSTEMTSPIKDWLNIISAPLEKYQKQTQTLSEPEKLNKMCEFNVKEQVMNFCQLPVVQTAWQQGQKLSVHGYIYDVKHGLLKDLNLSRSALEKDGNKVKEELSA